MYEDDTSESTGSESESGCSVRNNKRKRVIKARDNDKIRVTWIEAAEMVLSQFNYPLPHKEILRLIEESDLKTTGRGNSAAPLAVLNAMLNSNSKGPRPLFYKSPAGGPCYGLTKNRGKGLGNSTNTVKKERPVQSYAEFKKDQKVNKINKKPSALASSPAARNLKLPGQTFSPSSLRVKKPLIPPGASKSVDVSRRCTPPLGTLSKAAYYERLKQQPPQQRRMGPTTSALVRPAPPFSRPPAGAALRVPPGAALRVMPPKKRVKIDQDDNDSDSSSQSKNDNVKTSVKIEEKPAEKVTDHIKKESLRTQARIAKPITPLKTTVRNNVHSINKLKNNNRPLARPTRGVQQRSTPPSRGLSTKSFSPMKKTQLPPPVITTKRSSAGSTQQINNTIHNTKEIETNKQTFFVGVKFKKLKKGIQDPLKRGGKESKLDFMTPDSVLNSLHFKDLFNASTFNLLPAAYQYQLLMLLPECDRVQGKDGSLRLSPHSLSNGFFSRACQEYKDKLLDGDLNSDILQRAKQEVNLYTKLDPWKVEYFEPVYGQSSVEQKEETDEKPPSNIEPVESSWVAFLKFAENSTGDFEEALTKIQAEVQKIAEREAKEKEEEERRRSEALLLKASLPFVPSAKLGKNQCRPLTARSSPVHGSPLRSNLIDKEKSKKALKKAQLLRRKKVFDKQLKDAQAKLVEEACLDDAKKARIFSNIAQSNDTNNEIQTGNLNNIKTLFPLSQKNENTIKSENQAMLATTATATTTATTDSTTDQEKTSNTRILDIANSVTLKKLIQQQHTDVKTAITKKSISSNAKRRQGQDKPISRVVHGAATFGTNSNGACPCNVKAMYLCKQCGSAWHGDCINNDKICILCS